MRDVRWLASALALGLILLVPASLPVSAQTPPAYVALGDSIEYGLGDDVPADGIGYVSQFGAFLSAVLGVPVDTHNLGIPFATARDILQTQVPVAESLIEAHDAAIVSWGGGGNDLGRVALTQQANACRQSVSCLGRFNGLLNEVEATIDHTIAALRQAAGPDARILMRTQYNALRKSGCGTPDQALLGDVVLEGAPGTTLTRGLNDRIRTVAARYDASVVDLFPAFFAFADTLVASDCIHPSGAGYQAILTLFEATYVAGP